MPILSYYLFPISASPRLARRLYHPERRKSGWSGWIESISYLFTFECVEAYEHVKVQEPHRGRPYRSRQATTAAGPTFLRVGSSPACRTNACSVGQARPLLLLLQGKAQGPLTGFNIYLLLFFILNQRWTSCRVALIRGHT